MVIVTVKVAAFTQIIEGTYDTYRNGGELLFLYSILFVICEAK